MEKRNISGSSSGVDNEAEKRQRRGEGLPCCTWCLDGARVGEAEASGPLDDQKERLYFYRVDRQWVVPKAPQVLRPEVKILEIVYLTTTTEEVAAMKDVELRRAAPCDAILDTLNASQGVMIEHLKISGIISEVSDENGEALAWSAILGPLLSHPSMLSVLHLDIESGDELDEMLMCVHESESYDGDVLILQELQRLTIACPAYVQSVDLDNVLADVLLCIDDDQYPKLEHLELYGTTGGFDHLATVLTDRKSRPVDLGRLRFFAVTDNPDLHKFLLFLVITDPVTYGCKYQDMAVRIAYDSNVVCGPGCVGRFFALLRSRIESQGEDPENPNELAIKLLAKAHGMAL